MLMLYVHIFPVYVFFFKKKQTQMKWFWPLCVRPDISHLHNCLSEYIGIMIEACLLGIIISLILYVWKQTFSLDKI